MGKRKRKTVGPTNIQRVWAWLHLHGERRAADARIALRITRGQAATAMRRLRLLGAAKFVRWDRDPGHRKPPRAVWTALGDTMPIDGRGRSEGSKYSRTKGAKAGGAAWAEACRLRRANIKPHPTQVAAAIKRKRNEKKLSWNWDKTALESAWAPPCASRAEEAVGADD